MKVGWFVDAPFGDFAFPSPKPIRGRRKPALSARAVQACPAVNELEKRLFVVVCPFDIKLGVEKSGDEFHLYIDEKRTRIDDDILGRFLTFMPQNLWRETEKPVFQLLLPYVFVCDEQCYLTQLPPFLDRNHLDWPGTIISGRFEITNWPRILNFAFEFSDIRREITLRRGEPLCYFFFEGAKPDEPVELIEAENNMTVREFRKGIEGMPKFTSNTFSVMKEAKIRRPSQLLYPAARSKQSEQC